VTRAAAHKTTQDALLARNRQLQEQLQALRLQVAEEQAAKFREWTENEQVVAERNA
jgi:predicted Holliday junction resolvase-like endonuclease